MLTRLEKARLVVAERSAGPANRSDRKIYAATSAGQQRLADWAAEVSWPRPDITEFHLKLVALAAAKLADPVAVEGAHRRELLRRLRAAQAAVVAETRTSVAGLLLHGVVLGLDADLQWLDVCEPIWADRPVLA